MPYLLDAFQLKMIAIFAMLIDHVGLVFFPDILLFRVVGRLTAPIMAFFIAEGYSKTRDLKKYELRLFVFALISILPYKLLFGGSPFNILFDLLLGLLIIEFSQWLKKDYQKWILVILVAILAFCLKTDGRMGISTLVYIFYRYKEDKKFMTRAMSALYLGPALGYAIYAILSENIVILNSSSLRLRPLSLFALPLIFVYNGERGRNLKFFFYLFYPVHLFVLYVLRMLL